MAIVHSIGDVFICDKKGNTIQDLKSQGIKLGTPTGIDDYPEENALAVIEHDTANVVLLDDTDLHIIRKVKLEDVPGKPFNIRVLQSYFVTSFKVGDTVNIGVHDSEGKKLKTWDCYEDSGYKYAARLGEDGKGNILVSGLDEVRRYDVKGNLLNTVKVDFFTMGCAVLDEKIIVAVSETGR